MEFLESHNAWKLDTNPNQHILPSYVNFMIKRSADTTVDGFKALIFAGGNFQWFVEDYTETNSPVFFSPYGTPITVAGSGSKFEYLYHPSGCENCAFKSIFERRRMGYVPGSNYGAPFALLSFDERDVLFKSGTHCLAYETCNDVERI